jgi:hypothetical protein
MYPYEFCGQIVEAKYHKTRSTLQRVLRVVVARTARSLSERRIPRVQNWFSFVRSVKKEKSDVSNLNAQQHFTVYNGTTPKL